MVTSIHAAKGARRKRGRPPISTAWRNLVMLFAREIQYESGLSLAKIEAALEIGSPDSQNGRTFWAYVHGKRTMTRRHLLELAKRAHELRNAKGKPWVSWLTTMRVMQYSHDDIALDDARWRDESHNRSLWDKDARKELEPVHEALKRTLKQLLRMLAAQDRNYRVEKQILEFSLEFPSETGREEIRLLGEAVQEALEAALPRNSNISDDHFFLLRRVVPSGPRASVRTHPRLRLLKGGKK